MQETELVIAAQNGDTNAFERLVSLYQGPVVRYLRFRLSNEADVQEVFQETFVNAYRYLTSYNHNFAFSTWLFSIANNQCKKISTHSQVNVEPVSQEHTGLSEESKVDIWEIIKAHLSSEYTQLLWFYYVEDLSIRQIAKVLDRSLTWVKVNLVRVRNKLYELLKNHQELLESYGLTQTTAMENSL